MKKSQLRKCSYCNEKIDLLKDKWVKEKTRFIHKDCFITKQTRNGYSLEYIKSLIKQLEDTYKEKQRIKNEKKLKSLENKKKRIENRDRFIKYISETYSIQVIPSFFYVKLANINNGTYKGLKRGIPYEDLLDMFKRKRKQLDKIAFNKELKGQKFKDKISRINFDLAVIVNQYDSYLSWKERQKNLQIKSEKNNNDVFKFMMKQKQNIINNIVQQDIIKNEENTLELEIDSIIDDI